MNKKHEIGKLLHTTVLVSDITKSLEFYEGVLGLGKDDSRKLPFPGAWLQAGEVQIHLMELPNPDPLSGRPDNPGRDRHTAFSVKNLQALEEKLINAGIVYNRSSSGRNAIFTRDPDGNGLEFIGQEHV